MGLRNAQVVDALSRVGQRRYATHLNAVTLHVDAGGASEQVNLTFATGIGVVTGGNGAGKTTLLRGLRSRQAPAVEQWPARLQAVEMSGSDQGEVWSVRYDRADDDVVLSEQTGSPPSITVMDPAEETQRIRARFADKPNAQDLLDGTDPAPFDDDLVDHASRVIGRRYDFVHVYEIEGIDGDSIDPWFEIGTSGITYDALNSGRGELAALYLLWRLSRIEPNSIVVIDEPEAWLASFSQARLKESLAYMSVDRSLHFVLTSHSPDMYLGLSGTPVTIVESLPRPSASVPVTAQAAARALGAPLRPAVVLFTEDRVAAALTTAILREFDSLLNEAVEVYQSRDGESALKHFHGQFLKYDTAPRRIRLSIVMDGDQRRIRRGSRVSGDPNLFLPGNTAPDETLRDVATVVLGSISDEELRNLGISDPLQFRQAASRAAGADHHDWVVAISREFFDLPATCSALVKLCSRDVGFKTDCDELVAQIRALL